MGKNELYHHGVKGMKWGVWNEETRARYEGVSKSIDERIAPKLQKINDKKTKAQAELEDINKYDINSAALIKRYPGIDSYNERQFENVYRISKKEAVGYTERTLRNKVTRCNYRKKLLTGEEFTDEEKQLIKQDAIKTAVIVAAATGVGVYAAYKLGVFEKMHTSTIDGELGYDKVSWEDFYETERKLDELERLRKAEEAAKALSSIPEQSLTAGDYEQVIKQGFEFHRMSGWQNEDFSKRNALYVSATEADRDIYKAYLKDWHGTGERYEATLKAAKDIKVAGTNKQYEIFKELLEDNDYFDDFAQHFIGRETGDIPAYLKSVYSSRAREEFDRKGSEQFVKDYYKAVIYDVSRQDSIPAKKFLEKAKSMGYNALVDDFDRGTMSYTPLILIDPQDVVEQVGSTKISKIDKDAADERTEARGIVFDMLTIRLPDKNLDKVINPKV